MIGVFASVSSLSRGTIPKECTDISHSFHHNPPQGMWNRRANTLNLIGNAKTFRIAEIKYRSYLLTDPSQCHNRTTWKWIHQQAPNPLKNIKLSYFSTKHTSSSRYGPLQFRTSYECAIKQYLEARNRHCKTEAEYKSVVFRVGYTQIFRKEINKTVIVCCKEDDNLDEFPKLGPEHCSKYFTSNSDGSALLKLEDYGDSRHDETNLGFYLPDCSLTFHMPRDGYIYEVNHNPYMCHEPLKTPYFKGCCPDIKIKHF